LQCRRSLLVYAFFLVLLHRPPRSSLFPYTTLFRSDCRVHARDAARVLGDGGVSQTPVRRSSDVFRRDARIRKSADDLEGADLMRSEEHTSELQSRGHLVCRLLLEKKKRYDELLHAD